MSVTLINGDGNPRVLASQDADWYGALTGEKTCIVPINDNLSATITDSNTVEIGSGVCITKEGRRVQIDEGDIEEIIIPTGTQGVDTYYIIGFHLYINESGQQVAETFVETMASATDTITETTFKEGSSSIYVSLYRVKRSGLLMDGIERIIPIEAGGMANEIYAYNGMMGAKNLLGQPYYGLGASGGLTFSVDSDGVLTINGTATSNAEYVFKANAQNWRLPAGKYKVSGISGGSSSTYFMSVQVSASNYQSIYNGEVEINVTSTDYIRIAVSVRSGQTVDNLQIFPMVRPASDTDTTFRPYAKTNKQLTDDVSQINSDLSWKFVGRVTGNETINIPTSFRELHVVVKCPSDNLAPFYVIDHLINRIEFDNLSTSNNTWLVGGGSTSNTSNFGAITIINASHTEILTASVDVNSQDYLPYTITELYYR